MLSFSFSMFASSVSPSFFLFLGVGGAFVCFSFWMRLKDKSNCLFLFVLFEWDWKINRMSFLFVLCSVFEVIVPTFWGIGHYSFADQVSPISTAKSAPARVRTHTHTHTLTRQWILFLHLFFTWTYLFRFQDQSERFAPLVLVVVFLSWTGSVF